MEFVSLQHFFVVIKHDDEKKRGGKGLSHIATLRAHSVLEGRQGETQGRNRSKGRGVILSTGLVLLVCSNCFLYNPRPPAQVQQPSWWSGSSHNEEHVLSLHLSFKFIYCPPFLTVIISLSAASSTMAVSSVSLGYTKETTPDVLAN